jgi:S-DNA-T family DNA segregation ATPase FtsK/SpoIIIE
MAKKKKKTSSKKVAPKKEVKSAGKSLPDHFWRQATGIGMIVLAVMLLFGAFGAGGSLPGWLFDVSQKIFGQVAYFLPLVILFSAVKKLRSENIKLDRSTFYGLLVLLISLSGFMHLFVDNTDSLALADDGQGGGLIGHYTSSILLNLLSEVTAGIFLIFTSIVSIHFILKKPFSSWLKLFGLARREKKDEEEPAQEEVKEEEGFKINEGVPIQRAGMRSLKNTAQKLSDDESHDALKTVGDPDWNYPSVDLLNDKSDEADPGDVKGNSKIIEDTFGEFNIFVDVQGANVGPRVTQYTFRPPSGVRLTKITALENNLALNLAATSIRIEAPIPGKSAVGIEVPNQKSATVRLRNIIDSDSWRKSKSPLSFVVGKDIAGDGVVTGLDTMPHVLIAGATGSGKSVMINSLLMSLVYRNSPSDLKMILVDPKQVELTPYNDIPHLLTPVITSPEKCISALKWAVAEMERRYGALSEVGKRNIAEYNKASKGAEMPYIVIVIDELADLMMMAARDVEALIVRIAQKARAVGIHLVLATQRPSVDVITGLIKANVPGRIAFTVTSQVDSRTIIDGAGAEKLLGMGDMLYSTPHTPKPKRIQGVFVSDKEVNDVADFLRMARAPEYDEEVVAQQVQIGKGGAVITPTDMGDMGDDDLYNDAVRVVVESRKASASLLQRRLRVGYARAARLIEAMEDQGIISQADGSRPRDVLINSVDDMNTSSDDDDF